jgi:pimeloyl-ACP methyl ester carboxylesterase
VASLRFPPGRFNGHAAGAGPELRGFGWSEAPPGRYDWGGYAGFLLCLEAPERVAHFLALAVVHPWFEPPSPSLQALRRLRYQFILATPGVGPGVLRRNPAFVRSVLKRASPPRDGLERR